MGKHFAVLWAVQWCVMGFTLGEHEASLGINKQVLRLDKGYITHCARARITLHPKEKIYRFWSSGSDWTLWVYIGWQFCCNEFRTLVMLKFILKNSLYENIYIFAINRTILIIYTSINIRKLYRFQTFYLFLCFIEVKGRKSQLLSSIRH
jgi:hypothetical protein